MAKKWPNLTKLLESLRYMKVVDRTSKLGYSKM